MLVNGRDMFSILKFRDNFIVACLQIVSLEQVLFPHQAGIKNKVIHSN